MAKKKAAKKKQKPVDGNDPNALGLTGAGVEVVRIGAITKAINEYEDIKTQRCALTPQEVKTKQKVIELMEKHSEQLRNPATGNLEYHLDDNRYVVIEPAKVKIKFKDEKPAKKKKALCDAAGIDPCFVDLPSGRKHRRISFHSLRHSYTTWLYRLGIPKELCMKLTAHATEEAHDGYNHVEALDIFRLVKGYFSQQNDGSLSS